MRSKAAETIPLEGRLVAPPSEKAEFVGRTTCAESRRLHYVISLIVFHLALLVLRIMAIIVVIATAVSEPNEWNAWLAIILVSFTFLNWEGVCKRLIRTRQMCR